MAQGASGHEPGHIRHPHRGSPRSPDGDNPVLPDLRGQIPACEQIGTVTADGACETRRYRTAIIDRQATPMIPIRKTAASGRKAARSRARNALRATWYDVRAFWKRGTSYHARRRIEVKMRCQKSFERIVARDLDRQTAEIHIRIAVVNRLSALETAAIIRVA